MRQTYYYDEQRTPAAEPGAAREPEREAVPPGAPQAEPPRPERTRRQKKPKRDKSERGAALFLVFLALILGGTAVLLALQWEPGSVDIFMPSGEVVLPQPTASVHTELERAPTGDGTVLEVSAKPEGEAKTLQQIYQEVNPSIVSINAAVSKGGLQGVAQGTGVVMSGDGYIITNAHVIADSFRVDVSLDDGRRFEAKLVGSDASTDLAVLKIDAKGLIAARFGDSEGMAVGDTVAAIGNPMGEELRGTMTDGILSAINRDMDVDGNTMTLLQTTAALNTGNSGGALVNDQGQVIGITNMKLVSTNAYTNTVEGLGFAIPTATVKPIVDDLIAHGHVLGRPTLGVTVQGIPPEELETLGLEHGLRVVAVEEKSDAAGKLQAEDILLTANGRDLDSSQDLLGVKESLEAGENIYFQVYRDGKTVSATVRLIEQYELYE